MDSEMEVDQLDDDLENEILTPMWPHDLNLDGHQFDIEKAKEDEHMLTEVIEESSEVDPQRLVELSNSDKGSSQLANLIKHWEYRQANAVRLLREELDSLNKQWQEVEHRRFEILSQFEEGTYVGNEPQVTISDDLYEIYTPLPRGEYNFPTQSARFNAETEDDTVQYWKKRALEAEEKLDASMQREQILMEKMRENIKIMESQPPPLEELSQMLERADNFLHFILQNAPIVVAHMDKELRYRFIYNHFPSFKEEDLIGKTETEIFSGAGVNESLDFKREVLERGLPGKREITFDTELFGSKTFLIYVEPVFNKSGDTIGVNYIGMDVTDQVRKREKMEKLREEIAVQKAMETELNKTIRITEETMRAKQMLATMSHEIRSPLSGVVGMAEILATTRLDKEQKQMLKVMISSGDLVLQLINDILDLSKVESGVMKLEATKFRPREVVKHVLQTATASLKKMLTLEGHITDDVPMEVMGDVLRIRQILTNLVSNAIKFTHEGKVGIKLYLVSKPNSGNMDRESIEGHGNDTRGQSCLEKKHPDVVRYEEPRPPSESGVSRNEESEKCSNIMGTTVWIGCDVYDTGIGIPEKAFPTLFKKYMQVSAVHARKYGGTGLGLAICKQLVELMGGCLSVASKEKCGSTFTFMLPYKVLSLSCDGMDDDDDDDDELPPISDGINCGNFQFQPMLLGPLVGSSGPRGEQKLSLDCNQGSAPETMPCPGVAVEERGTDGNTRRETDDKPVASECLIWQEINADSNCKQADKGDNEVVNFSTAVSASVVAGETSKITRPQVADYQLQISSRNAGSGSSSYLEATDGESKPKILLVEDNKINVMVTQSMMKQLGHSIDVVYNGVEAVRAVQRRNYDLILMDVCMPVMDGLEATQIIRSYEETGNWEAAMGAGIKESMDSHEPQQSCPASVPWSQRIPIIAMTANALSESSEECYANGMDSFVSKPVTFQKLKLCLEQYLHA